MVKNFGKFGNFWRYVPPQSVVSQKLTSERHHTNISPKRRNSFRGLKCPFASCRPDRRRLPKTGRFLHLIANNYQFMPPNRNRKICPLEDIDSRIRANFRLNPSWGSVHKPRLFTNQKTQFLPFGFSRIFPKLLDRFCPNFFTGRPTLRVVQLPSFVQIGFILEELSSKMWRIGRKSPESDYNIGCSQLAGWSR